jgi:hypothetical protein
VPDDADTGEKFENAKVEPKKAETKKPAVKKPVVEEEDDPKPKVKVQVESDDEPAPKKTAVETKVQEVEEISTQHWMIWVSTTKVYGLAPWKLLNLP